MNRGFFDIRATAGKLSDMRSPRHLFSYNYVAAAYAVTRQRAAQLVAEFGWHTATSPELLFRELLDRRATPLRAKLADPNFRAAAAKSLATAAFRSAVKPSPVRKTKTTTSVL